MSNTMQLLVALSVLVGLFYYNAATVFPDAKDVDLDSSASRKGYPLHSAKQLKDYEVDSLSGYQNDSSRIIGGHTVRSSKDTPWIAAIYRKERFICTGVLIHKYWVLTAAHCVTDVDEDEECDDKYKKKPEEDLKVVIGDVDLRSKRFIRVKDVEFHKSFNLCKDTKYDYGLLKLERGQSSRRIICLSTSRGPYGRLYGFGLTSPGSSTSSVLKYYEVKLISDNDCEDDWKLSYLSRSKICHEGRNRGERSCSGDSGGPLVVRSSSGSRAKLVGVQSYGVEDCKDGYPEVAARVKYGRDWIKDVIGSYKKC